MLEKLLTSSSRPLFIIGQEKDVGKTVTLNRLRTLACLNKTKNIAMCSVGWDGEASDHLTGFAKPAIKVYVGDIVLTTGDLAAVSSASFKVLWSDSHRQIAGRLMLGACVRAGEVELIGQASVSKLGKIIKLMRSFGAKYILIDGALDRKTPLSAIKNSRVGLVYSPHLYENQTDFINRILSSVQMYQLAISSIQRPVGLNGEQVALGNSKKLEIFSLDKLKAQEQKKFTIAFAGGPLTNSLVQVLKELEVKCVIIDDPSRLFLSTQKVKLLQKQGFKIELANRPEISFVAIRCAAGKQRELAPLSTIKSLRKKLGCIPCFDPLASLDEFEVSNDSCL